MDSVYALAVKFLKGIKFGNTIKDKIILLLFIFRSIISLGIMFTIYGKSRALEIYRARVPARSVIIRRDNVKLAIPLTMDYLNLIKQDYELEEREFIKNLKSDGSNYTILDVGANLGFYTMLFSYFFPKAKIISIEASPHTFESLKRNCELNGNSSRIVLINKAVSDRDNKTIEISDRGSKSSIVTGTIEETNRLAMNKNSLVVQTMRIDTLAESLGLGEITLLKMDIEGAENYALSGAERLINERRIKNMIIEYHSTENFHYVTRLLSEKGYHIRGPSYTAQAEGEINGHIIATINE